MTKPQWEIELREKMDTSYAKGGFLTTDVDGSWAIDEDLLASFIRSEKEKSYQQGVEDMRRKCVEMCAKAKIQACFDFRLQNGFDELTNLIKNVR